MKLKYRTGYSLFVGLNCPFFFAFGCQSLSILCNICIYASFACGCECICRYKAVPSLKLAPVNNVIDKYNSYLFFKGNPGNRQNPT